MKTRICAWLILWLILVVRVGYSQSNVKLWTQTTLKDFSDNHLTNLVITNDSGGEVQLPHPLVKTAEDSNIQSLRRFVSRDSVGNYVWAFIQGTNVFVNKYSFEGKELSLSLRVNDTAGAAVTLEDNGYCKAALMNDGTFMVIWLGTSGGRSSIYGQLFRDDSVRIGSNFIVKGITEQYEQDERYVYGASIMAANVGNNFWFFYPIGNSEGFKIHVQRVDESGNKVGEAFLLNQENITKYELGVSVAADKHFFWAAWDGANGPSSWDIDLYLRRFNYDGAPLDDVVMVNDNTDKGQGGADLCLDNNSNLLIAWMDERDAVEPITSGQWNIYGQFFTADGGRVAENARLNSFGLGSENREVDADFAGDEFQVSWRYWDAPNRRYLVYVNKWKLEPIFSGEMISSVFDCGPASCNFKNITWNESPNPKSYIKFKTRTAKTLAALENSFWYGPSDTSDYYTDGSESTINSVHNGDRYVQYETLFTSEDGNSAILNAVSIAFASFDTIPPATPKNFEAAASHSSVALRWESNNENDLLGYAIHKGIKSHQYHEALKIVVPKNATSFEDDSVKTGTVYYYAIAAVDSNHNESSLSNEVFSAPSGMNIYVDGNATPGGDGSITHPLKTIQQGMNAALFGDTIRVLPGIYNDAFTTKDGVSLVGVSAEECRVNTPIAASDNCVIRGFTITGSLTCNRVSPIITENIFRGLSSAIDLQWFSSPTISKNFITECAMGITMSMECNPIITNNIIHVNDLAIRTDINEKPIIRNNTIIVQGVPGGLALYSFDTLTVENNIVVALNQNAYTYIEHLHTSLHSIEYNDFWNPHHLDTQVLPTNLLLDPQFLNMDLQDYRLSPSSPCVNAGNPDPAYNDLDGTRNDMGAYGGPDPIRTGVSSQLTRSLYVSRVSGYPGDTIAVFVSMDNPAGLAKAIFVLEYDSPLLDFSSGECTETTKQFTLTHQIISAGKINFSLSSNTATVAGEKEILKVKLVVNDAAKTGDASPLMLKNISLSDANLRDVDLRSVTDGAFAVNRTEISEHYIYVDKKSTGTEDGSREHPFSTISEAIGKAGPGDSILVAGGTYNERIVMKGGIHLIGAGASVTTVNAPNEDAFWFDHVEDAEVGGFTIKKSFPGGTLIWCISSSAVFKRNRLEGGAGGTIGIECQVNSKLTLEDNYFKEASVTIRESNAEIRNNVFEPAIFMSGIYCLENATIEIYSNVIHGAIGSEAIGIRNNTNTLLRKNVIFCDDGGWGILITGSKHCQAFNNIIKDKSLSGTGIKIANSTECEIINNSIVTGGKGIEEIGSANIIMNNIIVNNKNFGVSLSSSNYNYNDVWNNLVNYEGTTPGPNDISLDPLFADTTKQDYRLSNLSPCISSGNPDIKYNDIDGSRNDIGAYGGPYADSLWKYGNGTSLAIDSITASSVDTVHVNINGEGMGGITGIGLTLSYDPSLITLSNANVGTLARSFSLEKTKLKAGSIQLLLSGNKGIAEENGSVIALQLLINTDKTMTTLLSFDSATVTDEATSTRRVLNLRDGRIKIITSVDDQKSIPGAFSLFQNYPNPFNPVTHFQFSISELSIVHLQIYDILGREVAAIINERMTPGTYIREWNAGHFASGVYFYSLRAGNFSQTRKLILLK
jgi:hypothetical protein